MHGYWNFLLHDLLMYWWNVWETGKVRAAYRPKGKLDDLLWGSWCNWMGLFLSAELMLCDGNPSNEQHWEEMQSSEDSSAFWCSCPLHSFCSSSLAVFKQKGHIQVRWPCSAFRVLCFKGEAGSGFSYKERCVACPQISSRRHLSF